MAVIATRDAVVMPPEGRACSESACSRRAGSTNLGTSLEVVEVAVVAKETHDDGGLKLLSTQRGFLLLCFTSLGRCKQWLGLLDGTTF